MSLFQISPYLYSVFDAKRLIGRKFNDAEVQADMKHFPFRVFEKAGKVYVEVEYKGEKKEFVSACVLVFFNRDTDYSSSSPPKKFHPWFSSR